MSRVYVKAVKDKHGSVDIILIEDGKGINHPLLVMMDLHAEELAESISKALLSIREGE